MQEAIEMVQSVGFPIVIALLFYIDLRKVIKCNTQAIRDLSQIICKEIGKVATEAQRSLRK